MAQEEKKLSYEELEKLATQLAQENNYMKGEIQKYADFSMFKRLDYLFKVVENENAFSTEFVVNCVNEIEACIYPPQEEKKEA